MKGWMTLPKSLHKTWDLDAIFAGGSDSRAFSQFMEQLEEDIEKFYIQTQSMKQIQHEEELQSILEALQHISKRIKEAESYIACLNAQNVHDKKAQAHSGNVQRISAEFLSALTFFDRLLLSVNEAEWTAMLSKAPFQETAYVLNERRSRALDKLPPEQENLIHDLAVDGYHGWGELYNKAVSRVKIVLNENGEEKIWSAGQAANKMTHPDREFREKVFTKWEEAWSEQADLCAEALNRLGGFRQQMYKHRGWDSVLKEPLEMNRMSRNTLNAMWHIIERNKDIFVRYLNHKAGKMGLEALSWHDVEAPVHSETQVIEYDRAAEMIIGQFRRFSPKMAELANVAFEERWIEAEDRAGKRPGGFCTSFPLSKQTRIFMTYSGTASNVSTLAHELGHAFHQHVMNDLPELNQDYAMNVAETASTLAEMIVSDAAVKRADSDKERMALLEDKIERSIAFYMNIHARFLFETRFYEARKKGLVGTDELNELMLQAQKEAYCGALGEYHPDFWASKLHFYLTDVPFYNFPYTFGYMFSAGIYAHAERQGANFEDQYIGLLRDTGRMSVEQLAQKHLGVDLMKPDFWQQAMDVTIRDVELYLQK
jgi:oligoendopeptidase F